MVHLELPRLMGRDLDSALVWVSRELSLVPPCASSWRCPREGSVSYRMAHLVRLLCEEKQRVGASVPTSMLPRARGWRDSYVFSTVA